LLTLAERLAGLVAVLGSGGGVRAVVLRDTAPVVGSVVGMRAPPAVLAAAPREERERNVHVLLLRGRVGVGLLRGLVARRVRLRLRDGVTRVQLRRARVVVAAARLRVVRARATTRLRVVTVVHV